MEIWKDIKGYEGLYQISNLGNVKSLDRTIGYKEGKTRQWKGEIKKPTITDKGYLKVGLYKNGKSKTREIQRIVAETFIDNPRNVQQVNHINGIKTDNRVENLEWVTPLENDLHRIYVLKKGLKKVIQYDLKGNYIQTFDSVAEASKQTGANQHSISNVACGRRNKAGGYIWKYA